MSRLRYRGNLLRWRGNYLNWGRVDPHSPIFITINGTEYPSVIKNCIINRGIGRNTTCNMTLSGRETLFSGIPLSETLNVIVRRRGDNKILFSGISRKPKIRNNGLGLLNVNLSCIGHDSLVQYVVDEEVGKEMAFLTTGTEQLNRILTSGTISLSEDPPIKTTLINKSYRQILDSLREINGSIIWSTLGESDASWNMVDPTSILQSSDFPEISLRNINNTEYNRDYKDTIRNLILLAGGNTRIRTFRGDGEKVIFDLADRYSRLDYLDNRNQKIILPSSTLTEVSSIDYRWTLTGDDAVKIYPFLVPTGQTRYLRQFRITRDVSNTRLRLWFETSSTIGLAQGQDLVDTWETRGDSIKLTQGSNSITIPGPNNSNNVVRDSSEVYQWDVPQEKLNELRNFFNDIDTDEDVEFELIDGDIIEGNRVGATEQDRGLRFIEDTSVRITTGGVSFFGPGREASEEMSFDRQYLSGDQWTLEMDRSDDPKFHFLSALQIPQYALKTGLILEHINSGDTWGWENPIITAGGVATREIDSDISLSGIDSDWGFSWDNKIYVSDNTDSDPPEEVLRAFNPEGSARDASSDITGIPILSNSTGRPANGAVAIGNTLWAVSWTTVPKANWIRRMNLNTKALLQPSQVRIAVGSPQGTLYTTFRPTDITSDGTTIWVLGKWSGAGQTDRWFMYAHTQNITGGVTKILERDESKDFELPSATAYTGCTYRDGLFYINAVEGTIGNIQIYSAFTNERVTESEIDTSEFRSTAGTMFSYQDRIYIKDNNTTDQKYRAYTTRDRRLRWDSVTTTERDAIITRASQDPIFRVALLDTSIIGVSVPQRAFVPGPPVFVTGTGAMAVNGEARDLGGDGAQWEWSQAKQAIINNGPPLTEFDTLRISYRIQWIVKRSGGLGTIDLVETDSTLTSSGEAEELATSIMNAKSNPAERMTVTMKPTKSLTQYLDIGEYVTLDSNSASKLGVLDPTENSRWLIDSVITKFDGDFTNQTLELQKDKYTPDYLDYMRRTRRNR